MDPTNMNSTSLISLKSIYGSGDESEISELRNQNNKRLEELLQQAHKEMIRREKTGSVAETPADANNSTVEKIEIEQSIKDTDNSETVTEVCTEIKDPLSETNTFDWKQNNSESQINECNLHVLPKKSEKLEENYELFDGTRVPKNKYKNRKRRQQTEIVDLTITFQENHKHSSSKLQLEPLCVSSFLPVTNVWLQKRGADLFGESQQTPVDTISCTTSSEEKNLDRSLAASLVTVNEQDLMVPVLAEETAQIHKSSSTESTFIPPKPIENENWDSDSTEFESDDDSYKTTKPTTNMQEVANNGSRNTGKEIFNAKVKSLKNRCDTYKMINSHKSIEPNGAVSKKVMNDSKSLAITITENSEVCSNINHNVTKVSDKNCNNDENVYFSSECTNRNRPFIDNMKLQQIQHILKSNLCIQSFDRDRTPTESSNDRLEVGVSGNKLINKNIKCEDKCFDVTLNTDKPLLKKEIAITTKINFSTTSKQAKNFEINNNKYSMKDELSQGHALNNPEIKNINQKTYYFRRSHSTELKQDKPLGYETVSSESINEGVHNSCEEKGSNHLKNLTYAKTSADFLVQRNKSGVTVNTSSTQGTSLKIDDKSNSSRSELGVPLMKEVPIEQLLRYEQVGKDFEITGSHYSSKEQEASFTNSHSSYPTITKYGPTSMFPPNTIPFQTICNPEMNSHSAVQPSYGPTSMFQPNTIPFQTICNPETNSHSAVQPTTSYGPTSMFPPNTIPFQTICNPETNSHSAVQPTTSYGPTSMFPPNTIPFQTICNPETNSHSAVQPTTSYGPTSMYPPNTIPLFQTCNPETSVYIRHHATGPHNEQAISTGWVPYFSPGGPHPSRVKQAHTPPNSINNGAQTTFLNPSQLPGCNLQVSQPPGALQQFHPIMISNRLGEIRNKHEPSSGTLTNPYFPVTVPQVINPQQVPREIVNFDFQQNKNCVPMVQLDCGANNPMNTNLTENFVPQDYGLPPRLHSDNPHLSQATFNKVSYTQPPPPKAELYYQNLQNMMQVDVKALDQQMKNLLLQQGSVEVPQVSPYECTVDLERHKLRQSTPQIMTDEQNMAQYYAEQRRLQSCSFQPSMLVGDKYLNSCHQVPPPMYGNKPPIMWPQSIAPFTLLSGKSNSCDTLPPTHGFTNLQSKGVTQMTSLSAAAKGRGKRRNPDF